MNPADDERARQIRRNRRRAKRVLQELHEHKDELEKDRDEAEDPRSNALKKHYARAEENRMRAHTAEHHYADAQIFRRIGEFSRSQGAQLKTGLSDYGVKSFVDALVGVMERSQPKHVDDEDEKNEPMTICLADMGRGIAHKFKDAPSFDMMFGNMPEADAPPTSPRQRAERPRKGDFATQPERLAAGEAEKTETGKRVAIMGRELKRVRSVGFWQFVLDPDESFGYMRTVENLFYACILIKDRCARLDLGKRPPVLQYTEPEEREVRTGQMDSSQMVLGIDFKGWRKNKEQYGIHQAWWPRGETVVSATGLRTLVEIDEADAGE